MAHHAIPYRHLLSISKLWTILFTLLLLLQLTNGHDLEGNTCAILHTLPNFQGEHFTLKDGDQSVHLSDDPRVSDSSWNLTGSMEIDSKCTLELCKEPYFDGTCYPIYSGAYPHIGYLSQIVSANCTCRKECKCQDIFMKKSSCARAYLGGGCRTCNSLYIELRRTEEAFFPEEFVGKVEALRLRRGCSLTLYPEENFGGEEVTITSEVVEDFSGQVGSYECECDDEQFVPRAKPPRPPSFPQLIEIPETLEDVVKMMSDGNYRNHPGLRAANMSLSNGRSSKNAYILLLGTTGAGKSSTINLLFDNPKLAMVGDAYSRAITIDEIRIPVPIRELGVGNSELRVIDTPGLGDTRGLEQDATFLATLDDYLYNHEELKDRIPNVVLIFHRFDDRRFNGEGSTFVKMLHGLDSFRERITDANYSNVIFVLTHFSSETSKNQRRPDDRLRQFKSVIEEYSSFPKPIIITLAENKAREWELPMMNGSVKLPNNEYYPKNLFEKLELVTQKREDEIGLGVFRSAFRDSDDFKITSHEYPMLRSSSKIPYYFGILSDTTLIQNSDVSQLLQHAWNTKFNTSLRNQFPGSLRYLQKTLSMRNINTKDDVPRTTTEMLGLFAAIKHEPVIHLLLKRALHIEAPLFFQSTLAGYCYNVLKDTPLPTSPFQLEDVQGSDIGFLIPKTLTCTMQPRTKQNFNMLDTPQQYLQHRLQALGIKGTIPYESFQGRVKPGHNLKEMSLDGCSLSATLEYRLFDFTLSDELDLTPEFQKAVRGLPIYNESDYESVSGWTKFFNEYGTHVVQSVQGGGAIEIQMSCDKPCPTNPEQTLFGMVQFAEVDDGVNATATIVKPVLPEGLTHSLRFVGGNPTFHTNDLTQMSVEQASKLLTNWKKSLKFNPAVLTTDLRLLPISDIVQSLGQNYSSEMERTTSLWLNSDLTYKPVPCSCPGDDPPLGCNIILQVMNSADKVKRF